MLQQAPKSACLCSANISVKCSETDICFASLLIIFRSPNLVFKNFAFDMVLLCSLGCLGTVASLLHQPPPSDGIINYHDQLGGFGFFFFFETEGHRSSPG